MGLCRENLLTDMIGGHREEGAQTEMERHGQKGIERTE